MQKSPLLCLTGVLFLSGCLDWSTAAPLDASSDPATGDAGRDDAGRSDGGADPLELDAGTHPHDVDAGMDGGESTPCPAALGRCDGKCGTVVVDGCPAYECEPCDDDDAGVCMPHVSCESIEAQCGVVDNGCGTETCADQCAGLACKDYRCCQPDDVATTCRGSCGGTVINNCDQEVDCKNPCGPHAGGCEESAPPVAAVCFCPHLDQGETCEQTQFLMESPSDLAVDPQGRFVYVLDWGRNAVIRIDTSTGTREVLSDDDDDGEQRGVGPGFSAPRGIVLDARNNRLFVSDLTRDAILEVNLYSGNRRVLSDADHEGGEVGMGPALVDPLGMALDLDRDVMYVTGSRGELSAVNLTTGGRGYISRIGLAGAVVGTGPRFEYPYKVILDVDDRTAYVFGSRALIRVDLASGNRTLVSTGNPESNAEGLTRGNGPAYSASNGILQRENGRALVLSSTSLMAIDLTSGDRTVISSRHENLPLGAGPLPSSPRGITLDADRTHVLATGPIEKAIFRIDPATGDSALLYDGGVGPGPALDASRSISLRPTEGIAYVPVKDMGLLRIDLATGARTAVVSGFNNLRDAVVDESGRTAYVVDSLLGVLRVDLASGEQTFISDSANPAHNTLPMNAPTSQIILDPDPMRNRAIVVHEQIPPVIAVDLTTGVRTRLSGGDVGTGPSIWAPGGAAFDSLHNRLYLVHTSTQNILAIDLVTGNRTTVSGAAAGGQVGEGPLPIAPGGAALDAEANALYVQGGRSGLLRIDLTTGNRVPVSLFSTTPGASIGRGVNLRTWSSLTLDKEAGFVYISGYQLARFDLETGNRRIISRAAY